MAKTASSMVLVLPYTHSVTVLSYYSLFILLFSPFKGHAMSQFLSDEDHRDQVIIDSELPVILKLTCGAISGACAQSG